MNLVSEVILYLTNRRHFSMVYTLIDHKMTSKKCSKLKWKASGFTVKFWTFYGVILWSVRV